MHTRQYGHRMNELNDDTYAALYSYVYLYNMFINNKHINNMFHTTKKIITFNNTDSLSFSRLIIFIATFFPVTQ